MATSPESQLKRNLELAIDRWNNKEAEADSKTAGRFFCGSPPREERYERVCHVADFLSCCYLCRKCLHGKDIYMYRGEKAFCSKECRYQQIVSDEYDHDTCESEACRPSDISGGIYTDDPPQFFTGILAA